MLRHLDLTSSYLLDVFYLSQKVLNLKHAWEFILDEGVISYSTNLSILSHVANLVNEGFYIRGGRLRNVPVSIGGTSYIPPLPIEADIQNEIKKNSK